MWKLCTVMFAKGFCGFLWFHMLKAMKKTLSGTGMYMPWAFDMHHLADRNQESMMQWRPQLTRRLVELVTSKCRVRMCWRNLQSTIMLMFPEWTFAKNMLRILQKVDKDSLSPYVYIIHIHANKYIIYIICIKTCRSQDNQMIYQHELVWYWTCIVNDSGQWGGWGKFLSEQHQSNSVDQRLGTTARGPLSMPIWCCG